MAEENNIDKIFRTAASGFSASTPSGAWTRMESALAIKRRRRIVFWWLFSAGLVVVITGITLFWTNDYSMNTPMVQADKKTEALVGKTVSNKKSLLNQEDEIQNQSGITQSNNSKKKLKTQEQKSMVAQEKKIKPFIEKPIEKKNSKTRLTFTKQTKKVASRGIIIPESKKEKPIKGISSEIAINDSFPVTEEAIAKKDIEHIEEDYPKIVAENSKENIDSNRTQKSVSQVYVEDTIEAIDTTQTNLTEAQPIAKPRIMSGIYFTINLGFGKTGAFFHQPNLTYNTTASTSNALPKFSSSNGFNIAFLATSKWMVYANYQTFKINTSGPLTLPSHNLKYINVENFGYTPAGYYDADFVVNAMSSKGLTNIDYLREYKYVKTSIRAATYSLGAGRYGHWKKWVYIYRGGFSLAKLLEAKVYYIALPGEVLFGDLKGIKSNIFGLTAGGDLMYSFENHIVVGIKMDVNFSLNSVNKSNEFGYYPWDFFIGPQFGLKF